MCFFRHQLSPGGLLTVTKTTSPTSHAATIVAKVAINATVQDMTMKPGTRVCNTNEAKDLL